MKFTHLLFLGLLSVTAQAAVTIQTYQDSADSLQGSFLTSGGSALTSGGISIGYFVNNTAPSLSVVQNLNAGTAYSTLVSTYGYIDLRSLAGVTLGPIDSATGLFDWSYSDGILAGNPRNIAGKVTAPVGPGSASASNLPSGTRLYILGFDSGSFGTGFTGSNSWAFVGESSAAGTVPSDLSNRSVRVGSITGSEVWVGTQDGFNVRLAAVPEPTKVILSLSALGVLGFRRRR